MREWVAALLFVASPASAFDPTGWPPGQKEAYEHAALTVVAASMCRDVPGYQAREPIGDARAMLLAGGFAPNEADETLSVILANVDPNARHANDIGGRVACELFLGPPQ